MVDRLTEAVSRACEVHRLPRRIQTGRKPCAAIGLVAGQGRESVANLQNIMAKTDEPLSELLFFQEFCR